ncbi:MAG: class I tRNA ligase family protein, partial [Candidatus Limnocylindrales bacterium]
YLRLLHPVMPFVTEALWAAIPHGADDPDLLIVARWPVPGPRDPALETEVEAILELIRGIRQARAEAHLDAAAWLAAEVAVPTELGPTFDALRAAIERLARVRPLVRRAAKDGLGNPPSGPAVGALTVIAGELEAVVERPDDEPDAATLDLESARLERELVEAEGRLETARARLANEAFRAKAPPAVVAGALASEAELSDLARSLRLRLGLPVD